MKTQELKYTALINGLALARLPLLAACTPEIIDLSHQRTALRIRLDWRTRNHLGVMYFGALAMGAELSVSLKAIELINDKKLKIDFIFKDFKANFLRRADGPVHFICDQAAEVADLVEQASASDERVNGTFEGYAVVAKKRNADVSKLEKVMTYSLTLSMKKRRR